MIVVLLAAGAWWLFRDAPDAQRPAPSGQRLNIVLITIDTLRADRLGRGLTPSIDRLAKRGASFPQIRATVPLTLPSHVSIMTGVIPPVHGVRENGAVFDRRTPTLARILRDAGYRTAAFVGAYVLNRRFGLDEGFELYDDAVRRDATRAERLEAERPAAEVIDAALKWLPTARAPFFLWVHLYDPHIPYAPPQEYLEKAGGDAYDGEVAYADAQVGRLLDALDSRDLMASTAIVVTGDHGESLGEHGEQTHGMLLYDGALKVPLVIAAAGFERSGNQPCHPEIAPALLRIAGLDDRIPSDMGSGGHLMRRAGASRAASSYECDAYSETRYPRRAGWHALTATADSQWKLIASARPELYDLSTDPGEQRNVADANRHVSQAMLAALTKRLPQAPTESRVAPDAAERLRALGYVSGSNVIRSDDPNAPNPAELIESWTAFERALADLQGGRVAAALPVLKRLSANHPEGLVFQSTFAQALRESGRAREAVPIYRAAVAKWPGDPALFHDLAVAAREAGDSAEALRAEQAALALDPNSAMAQNGVGLIHADAGRPADAAAAFERAAAADSANASYWTNLGNARRAMNDARGAESAYRKALDPDGTFADALNGLGTLLVQSGRPADAAPLFERALQSDPELYEARLNLGIAYQQSGQRQRAAETYREVLTKTPPRFVQERTAAAHLLKQLK